MPRLHIRPSGPLIRPSVQQTGIATHGSQSTATKAQRIPRATVIPCGEGGVAELCGEPPAPARPVEEPGSPPPDPGPSSKASAQLPISMQSTGMVASPTALLVTPSPLPHTGVAPVLPTA